jgi:methylase of polypeptide subunit release factors
VTTIWSPLLDERAVDALRTAFDDYTVERVHAVLGLAGQAALARGDLSGVRRGLPPGDHTATLIRLFLLGEPVPQAAAASALAPLSLDQAGVIIMVANGQAHARVDIRPYAEAARDPADTPTWWVVSDFGSEVRPGPLAPDHVLGIGSASLTLAQATMREPVGSALDVGTGSGIQALHLSRHAERVVATDVSSRALRMAATTAALSGVAWDLRSGSLLEPVGSEQFDLVVANPPFVVSPGWSADDGGNEYRDGGLAGDEISRRLLAGLPGVLAPSGRAQVLANWVIPADGSWIERLTGWLRGSGCRAWVWQREVAGPGEYVSMWLRDAGIGPGTPQWSAQYDAWVDWFEENEVAAVGMGLVTLWRTDERDPAIVCEDVPQSLHQPVGPHIATWERRARWLDATTSPRLLASALRCADQVVCTREALRSEDDWRAETIHLRQLFGLGWEVEADAAVVGLLGACDGHTPVGVPIAVLAAGLGVPTDEVAQALEPVLRDLIRRGYLEPPGMESRR